MKQVFKSTFAVFAGFAITFILSIATDTLLENTGVFPSIAYQQQYGFNVLWMNLLAILYRVIYTVFAGFVTAKLAPGKPMKHVVILGVVGTVFAIVGNIIGSMLPATKNVLPLWFMVALVVMTFPGVWYGGKLALGKKSKENLFLKGGE